MSDPLPPDLQFRVRALAAAGRDELERHLFGPLRQSAISRLAVLQALGAVAIGILAAGIAVFLIVVILNLVFHYVPS